MHSPVMARAIAVRSIDEEDEIIGRCLCEGSWLLRYEAVTPDRGTWLDNLRVSCRACGGTAEFSFDIGSFFEARPGIWANGTARATVVCPVVTTSPAMAA